MHLSAAKSKEMELLYNSVFAHLKVQVNVKFLKDIW